MTSFYQSECFNLVTFCWNLFMTLSSDLLKAMTMSWAAKQGKATRGTHFVEKKLIFCLFLVSKKRFAKDETLWPKMWQNVLFPRSVLSCCSMARLKKNTRWLYASRIQMTRNFLRQPLMTFLHTHHCFAHCLSLSLLSTLSSILFVKFILIFTLF